MAHDCMLDTRWEQAASELEKWLMDTVLPATKLTILTQCCTPNVQGPVTVSGCSGISNARRGTYNYYILYAALNGSGAALPQFRIMQGDRNFCNLAFPFFRLTEGVSGHQPATLKIVAFHRTPCGYQHHDPDAFL
eukprot:1151932-Pelagomonas_calceolata.AAC.6